MKRPIDLALGVSAVLPIILIPMYFFGRMETIRESTEIGKAHSIALVKILADHGDSAFFGYAQKGGQNIMYIFTDIQEGIDEWGIARSQNLRITNKHGVEIKAKDDLITRIKEASGQIRSLGEKEGCFEGDWDFFICGAIRENALTGIVVSPYDVEFGKPAWYIIIIISLSFIISYFIFKKIQTRYYLCYLGAVGVACGIASAFLTRNVALKLITNTLEMTQGLKVEYSPDPALGFGFVLSVSLLCALVSMSLTFPISNLFFSMRTRPLIYISIAPAMIGMILLIFVPFFMGVYLAFLDNNGRFVFLDNFIDILFPTEVSDTNFYFTLGVTVLWTVLNVGLHVVIGLSLALILSDSNLRGKGIFRVLLIVPWAIPNYITALIWKWIFNTQYGPANAFLGLLGVAPVDWLGQSFITNFTANLVTNTWLGFPFMMIVSLGALQSIPADLYEAAEIDGAGRWQRFRHVTLPLLKPALFPAIILGTIWTFNMFNVVYLVSGGAPDNKTNILITEAYRAFRVLKNFGLAAAYSLIIFFILAAYTALTNRITKAAESVYE